MGLVGDALDDGARRSQERARIDRGRRACRRRRGGTDGRVNLAFLFPGQGAQAVGMGAALAERHPVARHVFERADRALGYRLSDLCWKGPAEELTKTVHAQPALLTHSIAAYRLLEDAGIRPRWVAGHSLGEYSACVAAGALDFEDAVRLVHRRGELMYQAGLERPGTMAAILGLDAERVAEACARAAERGIVTPANLNAPEQIVISGERAAVERACELARELGAKRAIVLTVSGAFHSPLMSPASAGLAEALAGVSVLDAKVPVIANVSAEPLRRGAEIRAALERQLLGAVRWEDSMRRLVALGAQGFVEVGTGTVLRGLLRSLDKAIASWDVGDPESFEKTVAALGDGAAAPSAGARAEGA
ncbi:MAG: ACP S-malonyltransferase [Candidatus Eisenbacteria bacterium]|uniref:[acyl-carrier-protein] S-malonyltransferase n=1 Tax=Eiseniibacteriota bacterium TaxID=2212470 RepID=A0A9D6QJB9_UNCEI|nr:ACP S-malonyltransferase [Candidatus Eisenbacteria bacterium]MBI3540352.1 ACP S-malonyltransferase [Candidatus Eisenbacteria bacterium]